MKVSFYITKIQLATICTAVTFFVIWLLSFIYGLTLQDNRTPEAQAKDVFIAHLVENSNEKLIRKIVCKRIDPTNNDLSIGVKYHIACQAISLENNWTIYLDVAFGARDQIEHYNIDGAPNG